MLNHVFELTETFKKLKDKILIIGKGPSAQKATPQTLRDYITIGINQASYTYQTDLSFFIDYEPYIDCTTKPVKLPRLNNIVIFPYVPHWREKPQAGTIEQYLKFDNSLKEKKEHGLFLSYDLCTGEPVRNWPNHPVIQTVTSSTEAILDILGYMGIKSVHTLGIDGGKERADPFKNSFRVNDVDYSIQQEFIQRTLDKYKMELIKL